MHAVPEEHPGIQARDIGHAKHFQRPLRNAFEDFPPKKNLKTQKTKKFGDSRDKVQSDRSARFARC